MGLEHPAQRFAVRALAPHLRVVKRDARFLDVRNLHVPLPQKLLAALELGLHLAVLDFAIVRELRHEALPDPFELLLDDPTVLILLLPLLCHLFCEGADRSQRLNVKPKVVGLLEVDEILHRLLGELAAADEAPRGELLTRQRIVNPLDNFEDFLALLLGPRARGSDQQIIVGQRHFKTNGRLCGEVRLLDGDDGDAPRDAAVRVAEVNTTVGNDAYTRLGGPFLIVFCDVAEPMDDGAL